MRKPQTQEELMTPEETRRMAAFLWEVTEFCWARKGRWCFQGWPREKLFRYVSFCQLTKRLFTLMNGNQVLAVVFAWKDWGEHIEARAEEGLPQFAWTEQSKRGDALFVAEVLGDREKVRRLARWVFQVEPELKGLRVYTYRRGDLVQLDGPTVERFFRGQRS